MGGVVVDHEQPRRRRRRARRRCTSRSSDGRILQPVADLGRPGVGHLAAATRRRRRCRRSNSADSDRVRRGQWVLAFGSPFGLNQTVTHGIISATDRGQISLGSTIRIKEFLQTDAAINPGSSGGPLVDLDGRVVGINTAIASKSGDNSGVSFSIPANLVKRIAGAAHRERERDARLPRGAAGEHARAGGGAAARADAGARGAGRDRPPGTPAAGGRAARPGT